MMLNTLRIEDEEDMRLAEDILLVLRQKELTLPKYKGSSEQLCFRRYLVDWLAVIGEKFDLTHGMLHLAISFLDMVMDSLEFRSQSQLNLLALCCLWVATKVDERDDLIPRVQALKPLLKNEFDTEDFIQMELHIMSNLDWRLLIPTPVQFINYFLREVINDTDLHVGNKITQPQKAELYIRKYTWYFLEVSLQDHEFNRFLPSQVAASSIAASRSCLKITPVWPVTMATLTRYPFTLLEPCIAKLLQIHEEDQNRSKSVEV